MATVEAIGLWAESYRQSREVILLIEHNVFILSWDLTIELRELIVLQ